jgi:hypothetical protein
MNIQEIKVERVEYHVADIGKDESPIRTAIIHETNGKFERCEYHTFSSTYDVNDWEFLRIVGEKINKLYKEDRCLRK